MTEITKPRRPRRMARESEVLNDCCGAPAATTAPASAEIGASRPTKARLVIDLLGRDDGASLPELCDATDWQPHTCRAFLTGLRKKAEVLERAKRCDGITAYRLVRVEVAA